VDARVKPAHDGSYDTDTAMTSSNEPAARVVEIEGLSLVFETADGPAHARTAAHTILTEL
jgi:hypothetical protein